MPDNTPPDWVADRTFFDEGWVDMDRRLSARTRRRYALYVLPLLAILLLLAGTLVLWPNPANTPQARPSVPATATTPAAINTRKATPSGTATEGPVATRLPLRSGDEVGDRKAIVSTENAVGNLPDERALPALTAPARPAQPYVVDTVGTLRYLVAGALPPFDLPVIAVVETAAPFVARPQRWNLTAGASQYLKGPHPGYFGQLTYTLPVGRWLPSVGLRVDRNFRTIESADLSQGNEALNQLFNRGSTFNYLSSGNGRTQLEGPASLSTTTLEGRLGMGRRIGNKLTVNAGAGVAYLLRGTAPTSVLVNLVDNRVVYLQADDLDNRVVLPVSAGSIMQDALINTPINRIGVTGWLSVDYRLGQRVNLTAALTQGLSRTYRDGRLGVSNTRGEFGVGYTF